MDYDSPRDDFMVSLRCVTKHLGRKIVIDNVLIIQLAYAIK